MGNVHYNNEIHNITDATTSNSRYSWLFYEALSSSYRGVRSYCSRPVAAMAVPHLWETELVNMQE